MRIPSAATSVALALVTIVGCGGYNIDTSVDYEPGTDFGSMSRYAWLSAAGPEEPLGPMVDNPTVDRRVRYAINQGLVANGYQLDADDPDFLVGYTGMIGTQMDVTVASDPYADWPGYIPMGPMVGAGGTRNIDIVEEGMLVLDFLDARSGQHIWRGAAQAEIDPEDTLEERDSRIREGVRLLLEQFPPAQ